jgi:hypothetical protein
MPWHRACGLGAVPAAWVPPVPERAALLSGAREATSGARQASHQFRQPPGRNRIGGQCDASRGVCFHVLTAADPVIFWSRRGAGILDHLQVHGVPVDRSLTQLSWGAHLDHP